jgi:glutamine synthetase
VNELSAQLQSLMTAYPQAPGMELLVPDLNGILRGKRIQRSEFERLVDGLSLPQSMTILDSRGRVVESLGLGSRDGDPDGLWRPVSGTLSPVPWSDSGLLQCLLDIADPANAPAAASSRALLKQVVERLRADGLYPTVAVELEFYLLSNTQPPAPAPARVPGTDRRVTEPQMYSLDDLQSHDALFADINEACELQNLPAVTAISEYAPGQFEINLHHVDDPLLACDQAVLLRRLVRGVARQHGLAATFMAKPFTDQGGSGQHVHLSVTDADATKLFTDVSCPAIAQVAAGLLRYLPECMPLFCPNPNSYRRIRPDQFAPVAANWGHNHRGLAVRLPLSDSNNIRVEHRVAGADANSYLVMAAILAAAHSGIRLRLEPPAAIPAGTEIEPVVELPDHWQAGLAALEAGDLLTEYLGKEAVAQIAAVRRFECEAFDAEVSSLDHDWYLRSI